MSLSHARRQRHYRRGVPVFGILFAIMLVIIAGLFILASLISRVVYGLGLDEESLASSRNSGPASMRSDVRGSAEESN